MKALNLGCGQRFHPDWTNIDKVARPGVRVHDLSQRMPFTAEEFDVVYLSHVLEHFSKTEGIDLLRECNRVCRRGGVIRIVVPDLEQIIRLYLLFLESAISNDSDSMKNYDWMMLELYDQAVRERSGGTMLDYLSQNPLLNEQFIIENWRRRTGNSKSDSVPRFRRHKQCAFIRSPHVLAQFSGGEITAILAPLVAWRGRLSRAPGGPFSPRRGSS